MELFNDAEHEQIRKEFTFNSIARYNRNNNATLTRTSELDSEAFTEWRIDTNENELLRNVSSKSIILAPFNTTQTHMSNIIHTSLASLLDDKDMVMWLGNWVKECDRQYEINNNGELDNGVYNKFVNNTIRNDDDGDKANEEIISNPTTFSQPDTEDDYVR